ncbi:MAG: patatin-like phospholipase family protein, partial [Acidobacteriota bacterium]
MSEQFESKSTAEIPLPKVLREELNHITGKQPDSTVGEKEKLEDVFKDFHKAELSALCFSGGGIRSATFGLGIVQALAKHRLLDKFDYLSTVSGGGYLGSWLSAWIRREQLNKFEVELIGYEIKLNEVKKRGVENNAQKNDTEIDKLNVKIAELNEQLFEVYKIKSSAGVEIVQEKLNAHSIPDSDSTCPNIEPKQLQYLRQYSNYMSPRVGLLSADTWTLLGIYTRNLFLNWTIFIPLISAFLLIPRFFLAFTHLITINKWITFSMLPIGFIAGSLAVAFVVNKLPSKNTDTPEIKHNNDGWVLAGGILPLLILAFTTTTFWAWYHLPGTVPESYYNFFQPYSKYEAANFTVFMVSIFLFGYLIFHFTKRPRVKLDGRGILAAFFSSVIGGFVLWMVAHNFFEGDFFFKSQDNPNILLLYVCIAVPIFLLVFLIAATIFVGLSSMFVTDDDREWLARFGAWLFIFTGAWSVLNGLVLFGPIGLQYTISAIENLLPGGNNNLIDYVSPIVPLIAAISGLLSLGGGFSGKSTVRDEPTKSRLSMFLSIAPRIAAVVFLAFVFVGLAYLSSIVLTLTGNFFNEFFDRRIVGLAFTTDSHLDVLYQSSIGYLLCWLIGLSIIGIGMAFFVNVNKFSLHGAYRDRLIRAYLGASHVNRKGSAFTGFDDTDNFQLHRLKGQKPFHIINATLNLIDGKNLAWQDRKAASFTMSPLHCGNWLLGYRYTNEYSRNPNL